MSRVVDPVRVDSADFGPVSSISKTWIISQRFLLELARIYPVQLIKKIKLSYGRNRVHPRSGLLAYSYYQ